MSASPSGGIQNFSKMTDPEKVYLIKLLLLIGAAIVAGIITGITKSAGGVVTGLIGFGIFFAIVFVSPFLLGKYYDLRELSQRQQIMQGAGFGFFIYIFFWVVTFNFFF